MTGFEPMFRGHDILSRTKRNRLQKFFTVPMKHLIYLYLYSFEKVLETCSLGLYLMDISKESLEILRPRPCATMATATAHFPMTIVR